MPEEKILKELKITIEFSPALNSFSSSLTPPAGATPEFIWEGLKVMVMQMLKAAPYYSDPVTRENVELAAKSMRFIVLGASSAIAQARQTQQNIARELQP